MKQITGIQLSPGRIVAPVFFYQRDNLPLPDHKIPPENIEEEIATFSRALKTAITDLKLIQSILTSEHDKQTSQILEGQILILQDPSLIAEVKHKISHEQLNSAQALKQVLEQYQEKLAGSSSEVFQQRTLDIQDVERRILGKLVSRNTPGSVFYLTEPHIIVSDSFFPTDFFLFDHKKIAGLVTAIGGINSHVAILCREFNIPYLTGVNLNLLPELKGKIFLNASENTLLYDLNHKELDSIREQLFKEESAKSSHPRKEKQVTPPRLLLNVSFLKELELAQSLGAAGIGLYRTEFLCLESGHFPDENEQFQAYCQVLKILHPAQVTFRTFDFGLDKFLDLFDLQFVKGAKTKIDLGGIRFTLNHPEILSSQLRALLKAAPCGNISIMLPMIRNLDEIKQVKELLQHEARKLSLSQPLPDLGIMVETKEAVENLSELLNEVDFISIGTNDLLRYTMQIDREKETSHQDLNPQFLGLLHQIIEAAHRKGLKVSVCGEMASDPYAIPLLIAMNVDFLSINPGSFTHVRELYSTLSDKNLCPLLNMVEEVKSPEDVQTMIKDYLGELYERYI